MLICAHRGASDRLPENTIVALAQAIELGCDYIEFDVRATRDERLVLMHDERLERTTDGVGRVGERTLQELRPLDAGSWMGEETAGRKIPTLNETLAVVKGAAPFLLDFKEERPALIEELVLSLRADDVMDKVLVTSPHAHVLETLASKHPDIPLAAPYRLMFSGTEPVALGRVKPRLLHARLSEIEKAHIAAAHAASLKVLATVGRDLRGGPLKDAAARAESIGLDGILTASPAAFLSTGLRVL
jgi:glycerophosphoryl diester phosphodiesterase